MLLPLPTSAAPYPLAPVTVRASSLQMALGSFDLIEAQLDLMRQRSSAFISSGLIQQVSKQLREEGGRKVKRLFRKQSTPGSLILVRHGQSTWNDENRFTGWANVPLSDRGREEAREAAQILLGEKDLTIDACYTSVLYRSVETANICLDVWECAGRTRPQVFARWRLNERHYGMLTGLNKREALGRFSASDLRHWRASFEGKPPPMEYGHPHYSRTTKRYTRLLSAQRDGDLDGELRAPGRGPVLKLSDVPLTESLAETRGRVGSLWHSELFPQLMDGKTLLLVGHANCLRALVSVVQGNLRDEDLPSLGLPNALPLVYEFDESGAPVRRPSERCYIRPLDAHYLGEACAAFNALDADGDGALDADAFEESEFCQAELAELGGGLAGASGGEAPSNESCGRRLMSKADNNNDGAVDFNEYLNWQHAMDSQPQSKRGRRYRDI